VLVQTVVGFEDDEPVRSSLTIEIGLEPEVVFSHLRCQLFDLFAIRCVGYLVLGAFQNRLVSQFMLQCTVGSEIAESKKTQSESFAARVVIRVAIDRHFEHVALVGELENDESLHELGQLFDGLLVLHGELRFLAELVFGAHVGSQAKI